MNILILGNGKGSFTIRARQLGEAIGARVKTAVNDGDLRWADVVVLIKKAGAAFAAQVRKAGRPIVWDALDCWAQPALNHLGETAALAFIKSQQKAIRPVLTIGATEAMAASCGGVYLPHHSWAGLHPTPAREHVQVVAYEGNAVYLGQWRRAVEAACARRGWRFLVNPPDLRAVDLLVAFRDGPWDGWICREWKSGVKAVNAIAAGRPLISQYSAATRELQPEGSIVEQLSDLDAAFDWWTDLEPRQTVVDRALDIAPHYTLEAVAQRYAAILAAVPEAACALARPQACTGPTSISTK